MYAKVDQNPNEENSKQREERLYQTIEFRKEINTQGSLNRNNNVLFFSKKLQQLLLDLKAIAIIFRS
jgi:hypothetical protein